MIKSLRFALAAVALMAMPACTATLPDLSTAPPAPLERTTIDEKALSTAWAGLGFVAEAVDQLTTLGVIVKGTPRGNAVKDALLKAEAALDAATAAKDALSASSYATAMADAKTAFDELTRLLKGT